jgi:S1-C subfamily serine protease
VRARAAATSALLALALLSGCGSSGNDESSAGTSTTATSPPSPPRVIVQTSEDGFNAARVYSEAAPGVVTIRSIFGAEEANSSDPFGGPSAAEGSGFVLDSSGHIVTNAHVVTDAGGGERKPASAVFVEFPDRNVVPAEVVGFDPFADVALLKVAPDGFDLHPLELGDDSELVVGQPVAAIGSPFGEQQSLSIGIVSATDRSVKSLTQFQIEGAIQTDASINPGNSGGPLLDAGARVIGINQQIETSSGANDGVGFAVPVSAIKRSVAQLKEDGKVEYAYIGVSSQALYPQLARRLGLDTEFGGLIAEVVSDGPADRAGLRGSDERVRFQAGAYETGGDVILSVNGREVVLPDDLARFISSYRPGEEVTLKVLRASGEVEDVQVTLGKRPSAVPSG